MEHNYLPGYGSLVTTPEPEKFRHVIKKIRYNLLLKFATKKKIHVYILHKLKNIEHLKRNFMSFLQCLFYERTNHWVIAFDCDRKWRKSIGAWAKIIGLTIKMGADEGRAMGAGRAPLHKPFLNKI